MNEEMMPYAQTEKGFVGVDNGPVRDNINIHLTAITARPYATPYHALEMVRKVLAPFHIGLPATNFLAGDSGHEIFEINQFSAYICPLTLVLWKMKTNIPNCLQKKFAYWVH